MFTKCPKCECDTFHGSPDRYTTFTTHPDGSIIYEENSFDIEIIECEDCGYKLNKKEMDEILSEAFRV